MIKNYRKLNYKMNTCYPPYENSSNNIKVELDLTNYATKDDVKNCTHVDVSSYTTKTNLAALKTEVDKIHVYKLKITPADLAKLCNVVKNDVVKKTDYNAKITSIEGQITRITKNTVDNLADITKLKAIDTNSFVTRTKFSADTNSLDDKIDGVEKKVSDISGLSTKTSLNSYLQTSTFNAKVTEVENKIKDFDIIAKSANTKANCIRSNLNDYAKKTDVATDITTIKNDHVSNASLTSQLNDLKSQHIATEVKTIDEKTKKNASDILGFESRLKQEEDIVDEVQRKNALTSGRDYYLDKMYLLYEYKAFSFKYTSGKINLWKLTGLNNFSRDSDMDAASVATTNLPHLIDNGRMSVTFEGAYFKQMKLLHPNNDNIVNIYIVYLIDPINNSRNTDYTVKNALFGRVKITKNAKNTSKHKYEGYGICFDEGGIFSIGNINNGRNVLIFGVHENSVIHSNNKANNIFIMGDGIVQGINGTTLYAGKTYSQNFTAVNKKFVLSLRYNGDYSYLFVNVKQELKFKAKDDQIIKEILFLGNISDDWTATNAQKTGLWGEIYDFAVDYTSTYIGDIYNIHRYLMKKHNI